jgi:predicted HAD superfamily phosphohydrolase YqeG
MYDFFQFMDLTCLFVDLDGRLICINSDDFADKVIVTNGNLRKT